MKIDSVNDLRKIIELCRKTGVESIKVDNVEIKLGEAPAKPQRASKTVQPPIFAPGGITDDSQIESFDALTDEQKLFYSVVTDQQ